MKNCLLVLYLLLIYLCKNPSTRRPRWLSDQGCCLLTISLTPLTQVYSLLLTLNGCPDTYPRRGVSLVSIHYCCKDLQPIPPPTNMHCSHSTVAFERLLKLTSSTYLQHEMRTDKRKCVLWFLVVSVKHTISLPTKNMKIGTPRIKVISQQQHRLVRPFSHDKVEILLKGALNKKTKQ